MLTLSSSLLSLLLAADRCPPLIQQELEPRRRHCVKSMRPFEDPDWVEHLADCDRRLRHTARVWGCPVPKDWGAPVVFKRPEPKED